MIKKVYTKDAVLVDCVWSNTWEPRKDGIHDINSFDNGIRITWVAGATFVPWSNVRCILEA